jgi:hypothetical protein
MDPSLVPPRKHLAWILATSADPALRDGPAARALAEGVCPPERCAQPELLQVRAAAEAAAGDFAAAVASVERAADAARAAGAGPLVDRLEEQLGLYRAGRALVDPIRGAPP